MVILPVDSKTIHYAAQYINNEKVVAIPTETVYGLAGDAHSSTAIQQIFAIKQRPQDNPLIVHCANAQDIGKYGKIRYELEKKLITDYMPGPLTLILPHTWTLAPEVYAGHTTVALRIPDHQSTLQLIRASNTVLAAPSANTSGRPSTTSARMVERDLGDKIEIILDGDSSIIWIESTIVQVIDETTVRIVRPGYIDAQTLAQTYDIQVTHAQTAVEHAPGNRYTHYAPQARVHIIETLSIDTLESLIAHKRAPGLIATKEFIAAHKAIINHIVPEDSPTHTEDNIAIRQALTIFPRGSQQKLLECAQSLYNLYHQCDQLGITDIFIEKLPPQGLGHAIMNRVYKSSSETK